MERRQIEYFVALAEHGSFTAAAAALFVAQPSLSHAIRALERDLGTELVVRLPRGTQLTAAGRAFGVVARQILRDFETARTAVDAVVELRGGELDIATVPVLSFDALTSVIGDFRAQHAGVRLRLYQPDTVDEVLEMVHSGKAELGLIDVPVPTRLETEIEATRLGGQEFSVILPPGTPPPEEPLPIKRLFEYPLIMGPRGTYLRDLISQFAKELDHEPTIAIEIERRESAMQLILAGGGAAILPGSLAAMARSYGAVTVRTVPPLWREIRLIRRPGALSPAATRFIELLLDRPDDQDAGIE